VYPMLLDDSKVLVPKRAESGDGTVGDAWDFLYYVLPCPACGGRVLKMPSDLVRPAQEILRNIPHVIWQFHGHGLR
jgi:hypothetical protein